MPRWSKPTWHATAPNCVESVRRILVTGAAGFVGAHLLPALRAAFPTARLIAATRGDSVEAWDEAVPLDLAAPNSPAECIRAASPDAVVHLAALAAVGASFRDPLATWRVNVLGTLALAEAVLAEAPGIPFVHASSAEVYGLSFRSGGPLNEEAPMRPANPYAASKAAADVGLGEMALRGLHAIRLRPVNHTGSGQSEDFVVAAFARQVASIAAGVQPPTIRVGALDRWRDFLDVRDVAAGYVAALRMASSLAPGSVFNLASGTPRHIGDMLSTLLLMAGIKPGIEQAPALLRQTDVMRTECDARAARTALSWNATIPWEETLATVLADWRARVR